MLMSWQRGRRLLAGALIGGVVLMATALGGVWAYAGVYGVHDLVRHGGTWRLPVGTDSAWLSPSMRLALGAAPVATPGELRWRTVSVGFDVADLGAMALSAGPTDVGRRRWTATA
jgi:hypothetical protein